MVHTVADLTPAGTAVKLAATRTPASWVMLSAPTGNAADVRIGDSTASATRGVTLKAGTTLLLPSIGTTRTYDLALIYVFGTTTDKVGILYGTN